MPRRLAEKLRQIRTSRGLSQKEFAVRLEEYVDFSISRSSISDYERGKREPPALVILAYSESANVLINVLADDALDLPGNS